MKVCNKCNIEYPLSFFFRNKNNKDGRLNSCKNCCREYNLEYKTKYKKRLYKQNKDWKLRNKDKVKSYMTDYRIKNKDRLYELNRQWIENNKDRYRVIKNACNAQRRANKKCAFVKWANKKKIKELYKEAQRLTMMTGIQHHVDHIIPLVNNKVCGLHVEHNLRVITAKENITKSNKLIEDIV